MTELELKHRFDLIDQIKEVALNGIQAQETIADLEVQIEELESENDSLTDKLFEIEDIVNNPKEDVVEALDKIRRLL